MNWIIPIGGKGTRTQALGEFKPFIEILNHKMLVWFFISIKNNILPEDKFYFVLTKALVEKFSVDVVIEDIFRQLGLRNHFELLITPDLSGVSAALYSRKSILQKSSPVIIINPDQYLDFALPRKIPKKSGYLTIYAEFSNKSGYVDIKDGKITKFVEKSNFSNLGNAGVFIVSEGRSLVKAIRKQMEAGLTTNGEYFLGTAFNYLIEDGFEIYPLPVWVKYDLGNIPDIEYFKKTPLAESLSKTLSATANNHYLSLQQKSKSAGFSLAFS